MHNPQREGPSPCSHVVLFIWWWGNNILAQAKIIWNLSRGETSESTHHYQQHQLQRMF